MPSTSHAMHATHLERHTHDDGVVRGLGADVRRHVDLGLANGGGHLVAPRTHNLHLEAVLLQQGSAQARGCVGQF